MIHKTRKRPLDIPIIQALQRRLPDSFKGDPFLEDLLKQFQAGYAGEKELDYALEGIRFDFPGCRTLQDLSLATGENHVQLDTVVVTAKGVFLFEVKHLTGLVKLDTVNRQMIQCRHGETRTMKDPFGQMAAARRKFRNLFTARRMPAPPVYSLLVFTNDHMELDASAATGFVQKWDVLDAMLALTANESDPLEPPDIKRISDLLPDHHRPQHPRYQNGVYKQ